ncbi:unnamed protein product [Closterium sp. NIES-64]|nr:unnamed protein product [Closterium sp. NIES-64]
MAHRCRRGRLRSRADALANFRVAKMSPEFQPDGRRSREAILGMHGRMMSGEVVEFEWCHLTADGHPIMLQFEWCHLTADGTPSCCRWVRGLTAVAREQFPVQVKVTIIEIGGESCLLAMRHDLTESKRKEEEEGEARCCS